MALVVPIKVTGKESLESLKKLFLATGGTIEEFNKATDKGTKALEREGKELKRLESRLDPMARKTQQFEKAQQVLNRELEKGTITQRRHSELMRSAEKQLRGSTQSYARLTDTVLRYAAAYLSFRSVIGLVRELADAQMQLERIQSRLRVAAGGDENVAGFNFDFISKEAKRLGLDLEATASSFSKLAAAAATAGVSGDTARAIFVGVSEASAAMGLSSAEAEGALLAIEQMMSKGRVSAEELRQQLGERLPGAFNLAAKAMGVSAQELDSMLRKGEVVAQDLLPRLAEELHRAFGSEAEQNVNRLTGATNNLKTAMFELKLAIIESGVGESLTKTTSDATAMINTLTQTLKDNEGPAGKYLNWVKNSTIIIPLLESQWNNAAEASRRYLATVERIANTAPPAFHARKDTTPSKGLSEASMDRAVRASVKAFQDQEKAAAKAAKTLRQYAEDLKSNFLPPIEQIIEDELPTAEQMLERITKATIDQGKGWEELALAADAAGDLILDTLDKEYQELTKVQREREKAFEEINKGFYQEVGRGIHDALIAPLDQFKSELVNELPKALQPFADALISAANEWLVAMLINIAKAKASSKGIGSAGGGGGAGGMGGVGALAGAGATVLAGVAVVAALAVASKYYRDQKDAKRLGTYTQLRYGDGGFDTTTVGRLQESGNLIASSIQQFMQQVTSAAGVGIQAMKTATITLRNDKKEFEVYIGSQLVGVFKDMNTAIVEAAKAAFSSATLSGEIDPIIRRTIEGFRGGSLEDLTEAIGLITEVRNAYEGLTELEVAISRVASESSALTARLLELGVAEGDAFLVGAQSAVVGFRNLWQQLSGAQLSPEEQMEQAERQRALLLAQMKLYRIELVARAEKLRMEGQLIQADLRLQEGSVRGRGAIVRTEIGILRADLNARNQYNRGLLDTVNTEVAIRNAELEAIQAVLVELDKLISEVAVGQIHIRGVGRAGGRGGLGGGREDRLRSALERLINAITRLREFQEELLYDQQVSPLTISQQFFQARTAYERILAGAQAGNIEDLENLPEAARRYLELAARMFGTAGSGYQEIFQSVQAALDQISGQYPETEDFRRWLRSDMQAVKDYLRQIRNQGRTSVPGGGGGGGGQNAAFGGGGTTISVQPLPASIQDEMRRLRETNQRLIEEVKGMRADAVRNARRAS